MAGNAGGFEDDPLAPESYSQLLFGDHDQISDDGAFGFTISSFSTHNNSNNTQKMLCFGDYEKQPIVKTGHNSEPACKDFTSLPISNKKKKRKGPGIQKPGSHSGAPNGNQRNLKNPNSNETSTVGLGGHAKGVRKEKLGDRITALQQLVSPFGKTDTASVLHEALGYIGFLQDQVHVLCSPYLQRCPTSSVEPHQHFAVDDDGESNKTMNGDLRSRGLCLVPMELTLHVADSNGADLWSSVAMVDR